jgi:hypothetical protein
MFVSQVNRHMGRALAQAVSRWLPTAAARGRVRGRARGVCGGQSGTGAGFLRVLRFPLPITPINTRAWHNRPIGGRNAEWTQLDSTPPLFELKKKRTHVSTNLEPLRHKYLENFLSLHIIISDISVVLNMQCSSQMSETLHRSVVPYATELRYDTASGGTTDV